MVRHRPYRPSPSPVYKLPAGLQRGGSHQKFNSGSQVSGHLSYCQAGHAYIGDRIPLQYDSILVLEEDVFNDYLASMCSDFPHEEVEINNDKILLSLEQVIV